MSTKRTLKFYKTEDNRWYIDLPEWTGSIDDLQMVLGADTLLDIISKGKSEINLQFSDEPYDGANVMSWYADGVGGDRSHGGGMYRLHHYNEEVLDLDLWLCDVTKFVFGGMPTMIFFNYISE